jgi:hypothetical protein
MYDIHLIIPVISSLFYIFVLPQITFENVGDPVCRKNFLRSISCVHNAFLCSFSASTFIGCCIILYKYGIVVEDGYYFKFPEFCGIMFMFYLTKYYEYVDTWLIYLKGKKPITLQTYHHVGAVIVWHLCYFYKSDSIFIATMFNSFVHTIMYWYYMETCMLEPRPYVKYMKKYITSMQIIQLVSGSLLSCVYYTVESGKSLWAHLIFQLYVIGLIILFTQFAYKTYITKKEPVD